MDEPEGDDMRTHHEIQKRGARPWLGLALGLALAALPGTTWAQSFDICGCEGSPDSLGDFDSRDQATWPPGTSWAGGGSPHINIPLPDDGVLVFDSILLANTPNGFNNAYLTFPPNAANTPVTLLVRGSVTIASSDQITLDGGNGTSGNTAVAGTGGSPSNGAFAGGDGAYPLSNLEFNGGAGVGPGGGSGALGFSAANGGTFVGVPELRPMLGGSGGGGGGSSSASSGCSGGGGGGGGGAILIAANGTINITGSIEADGGAGGGRGNSGCASGGGGGSGGAIRLVANSIVGNGGIFARGGPNGGSSNNGLNGIIRMEALSNTYGTNHTPVAIRIAAPGPLTNPITPTVAITGIDGAATPETPIGYLGRIDMIVPAPGAIQMDLETSAVPSGTDVEVTVKPKLGDPPIVERVTLDAADCAAGVCTAAVSIDLDPGAYIVEARATFETP
jgi:hypothetical protein